MRDSEGRLLTPGDVMPSGMCQPPVDAMALIERLSPEAAQRVLRVVAVWAPEVLEKGLQRVSEEREIIAVFERERIARLCPCGKGPAGNCPGSWHGCQYYNDGDEDDVYPAAGEDGGDR
jgi:hypothetical protein